MKAVMLSLRPQWCEKIFNGSKSIEVRKSRPSIPTPFTVYVYQTKHKGGNATVREVLNSVYSGGKVIGSFVCDRVDKIVLTARGYTINNDIAYTNKVARESCLYFDDLQKYLGENVGYAWHITDLKIYDKPRELSEFGITRAPMSWCYVEELQ